MTQGADGERSSEVVYLWPNGPPGNGRSPHPGTVPPLPDGSDGIGRSDWTSVGLGACVVEASRDGIEILDPDGRLRYLNPEALGTFGDGTSTSGRNKPWIASWPSAEHASVEAALALAHREAVRFSGRRPTKHGEPRDWDVVVSPLLDGQEVLLGFAAVSRDVTAARRREATQELSARETQHRLKNIFALVNGLITLSARNVPGVLPYARTLRERLTALGRALDYIQVSAEPHRDAQAKTLLGLLRTLLEPYESSEAAEPRIRFAKADDAPLGYAAVTGVTHLIHELATNAVKYGALSADSGHVVVTCERFGDALHLAWTERGGPPVSGPPERAGFGSTLIERSVRGTLGGLLELDWETGGLRAGVTMSLADLAR